jgi:hypothetical protein
MAMEVKNDLIVFNSGDEIHQNEIKSTYCRVRA